MSSIANKQLSVLDHSIEAKRCLKIEIVKILKNHLGETTSQLYSDFYEDQNADTILLSAQELLLDFLGGVKSETIINQLKAKCLTNA